MESCGCTQTARFFPLVRNDRIGVVVVVVFWCMHKERSQAATGALSALAKHQFSGILQTESDLELSMFWQEQH